MPNSNFGNIQYKASNGLIKLDELEGIVECFVSGIGNKDSVGDICATGAFAKSLQRRKPRVVWGHNWNDPIGKVLEIYEVPASDPRLPMKMKMAGIGGLYAKVQFNLQSEKGKEAFANVAFFGEEQEWSIGYKTLRAQYDENLQANVLYEVELYEVSPVLHGANQLTGTISVKSDEEKMHGMMPLVIGAPSSPAPRRDGIFDEGMSQTISGPQLAGVVAELSRRAGGPVMVVNATENSVVFVKPGKGKFRIGYHFTGSEYMFGKPELIHAEQAKPPVQSGPSPMPGIMGKPNKPSTNNPAMAMPVAMKPGDGGMIMVPLTPVQYEDSEKNKKPELIAEERELAESLVRIASKYGKFDEDGDGIWAGYYPPAENKVKDIGVKCSNCVLYQGEGKCKILDMQVEDEGKCRFAIIPEGVVVGYGKKQYDHFLDDEEIKMIEDIEAKYPGEFILGTFRNLVKKRRKKRKSYKTLEEWGVEELELEEKGLDPFLAHEYSYVIPVNLEDAFYFKSIIDPVLDYHRIDTAVNEYGIVINSPLSEESKDAISNATASAYAFLKKKIASEQIEEKALGRRIAGRAIDRPNIGGKKRRGGRGMGIPSGDLDPRTRRDSNLDGTLFDNVPGWEQPDPTPNGPGSINNPKPSKRQLADAKKPSEGEKLSSGTRNMRRHADRSADMEKQFPNAEENQKRMDHEAIAKAWDDQGLGWEEVPRYNADNNLSSDFLRGREIGVNQARVMWSGDSVRKRPEKFNEKQRASNEYSNWYSSYAKSVSAYLDAHSRDESDNWDGIESALRADVKSKYPDTQDWAKEDIATLNEYLNDIGLLDVDKLKKKKKKKAGTETEKGPDLQELRKLNSEGKLSSGRTRDPVNGGFLRETDYNDEDSGYGLVPKLMEEIGFSDEYEARDAMDYWNSLDDDEMKEFEDARNGDVYGAISDAWDESQAAKPSKEKLSSGDKKKPTSEEREEARRLRRAKRYEEVKNEGKGKESGLMWDENGDYKETVIPDGADEPIDELDEDIKPDNGYEQISAAENARRAEVQRASRERLFSPEGIEKMRLDRVKRNKGKETYLHNADGTLKGKPGLSSGRAKKYSADDIGDVERQGAMDIYGDREIYDSIYGEPNPDEITGAYGDDMGGRDDREPSYFLSFEEQIDAFYEDAEITDDDIASFLNDLPENERAWFAEESTLPRGVYSGTPEEYRARREKYDLPAPGFPSRSRESDDSSRLSSGANPQASDEIRRIVETNQDIERAALYVGLDEVYEGRTSRAMGARIMADANAGNLPESDGEQLGMAIELIDEFFPDASSLQKRALEQSVFGAIARNARESRVDVDWANSQKLSSGRGKIPPRPSEFAKKIGPYDGNLSVEIMSASNGLDLQINGKKVGRFRSNQSLDRFVSEVHVALRNRDGLSSGLKPKPEINVENVKKNIAELEAGGDRAKAVLKKDFRGRRYSDGTQFGSKFLGKDGNSYSTDIDITDEELEAYIRDKYKNAADESMRETVANMEDAFIGEGDIPIEIREDLMPSLPFYDEAVAEMRKDPEFENASSIYEVEDLYEFAPYEDLLFDTAQKQIRIRKRKLDQASTLSSGMRKFDDLDEIDKQQAARNLASDISRIIGNSNSDPDFDYGFKKFIDDSGDYESGDSVDAIRDNYASFLFEAAEKGDWETLEEHDVDLSSLLEYTPEAHPDREMMLELDKSDREWADMMSEMRRGLSSDGSSEDEVERILDHWLYSSDSPKQEEYLDEYREPGDKHGDTFNRAAKAMYQDHLERLYDNRQERNLSSGTRTPEQESRISDREIFERRMAGESLAETAKALGMMREEVRQAELRHMARERGTLQRPDSDDIETYREDQARMAAEEAAELALNESIYLRRMDGESLAETAKALGMKREEVRNREQSHMQLMRAMDREAKRWVDSNRDGKLSSGSKGYVSPLDDLSVGQKLSSGKLDEVYRSVQDKLIEQIEKIQESGDGKWEFPWHKTSLPKNVTNNNRPYTGINSVMLMFKQDAMSYDTALWAGFNQWKKLGGTVRKGEKGTMILIPTIIPKKKDADGNEIRGSGGIFFKTGHVFNIDQIDGIDKEQFKIPELPEEQRVAELEQALSEIGAVVNTGGDRAFYRPSTDEIHLPPFSSFKSREGYYAVFAHELMHWTGHSSRLKRDHLGEFGSPEYAQEELVAEIASAFFMAAHGLTPEPREDHAQYLASWLKKLKSDPDAMKKAFGEAQKAHDFAISKSPSMSAKLGKKVAEAGVVPGNDDGGYGDIGPSLSSGKRDKYMYNAQGRGLTLAEEAGNPDDEVLKRFYKRRPYFDGDKHYYEASASLGDRGVNQWSMGQADDGLWYADLMFMDGVGEDDEIDWDVSGVGSEGFKTPEEVAKWTFDYEESRRDWQKKFRQESDIEKIAEMLAEEEARRDAEYENSKIIARERMDREEYTRIISQIDESRLDWSPEDWADEASDIQAELMRENNRLSSGVRSRYDDKPVEEIGLVTDALQRTDEAGSNSRHIASRLLAVPVDKYDFDSIRRNGEVISFTYNGKPRMVYPTGMMTKKGGGIYFVGLDEESGQYRSFSLHKIEGLVDGAIAPINPTQPGVPQGTSFASGRRTRNVTSGRLSSGRSPEDIKSEFMDGKQYDNPITQAAFDGKIGNLANGGFSRIALEDHQKAIDALDDLVATRDEYIRAVLDGKKIPTRDEGKPRVSDLFDQVSEDELYFIEVLDSAMYDIESALEDNEENLEMLNEQTDNFRDNLTSITGIFKDPSRLGGPSDFESTMQRHIDNSDGNAEQAIEDMVMDAEGVISVLEEIEDVDDSYVGKSYAREIRKLKDMVFGVDNETTPESFASEFKETYDAIVKSVDAELVDLFNLQDSFAASGVSLDRSSKRDIPRDIALSGNLSNFDMVEGDAADFLEPGDVPGLSSGRRSRTQGSKRRPMSDADRQAFADGVRQRAATIPSKRRPGPSKEEFGTDRLSSGRMRFPDSAKRRKIGERISEYTSVKVGKLSENNDRSPDGKWMLGASKLNLILKDENGKPLNVTEIAAILGIDKAEAEKFNAPGAAISEADASTLIDQMFFNGSNPAATDELVEAIWGFDSKPYWYDMRRGNQLSRDEYEDYVEEGILRKGLLAPEGMEETEEFVASEMSRRGFALSDLADALGTQSTSDLMDALTFEVDGEKIVPTAVQMKKWKRSGIPTGIVEQLIENGIIPNAGDVFGEEGAVFDSSIKQFDLWKKVSDAIARTGKKITGAELDEIIGATKVQTRLKAFEEGKEGKYSSRVGKALRYSDDEVKEIVDRMNKKYDLNETVDSIKGGPSMSSGRRAARRISDAGTEATERLSSGRENNGAPENITPRMQKEILGWAENAKWSGFAQSVTAQFKAKGFLSRAQWTRLLQLHDNSQRRR
jgi:HK97 family phage prohead protease